jgi:hypothetical protein
MARRSKPARLQIQVSFEATRISAQCLVDAYSRLVPITRRRLRQVRTPDPGGAVAPTRRGGDHA